MNITDRSLLHRMNGQLISAIRELFPSCRWEEWILNVIVLYRLIGDTGRAVLQTSATWHFGELFDQQDQCGPNRSVKTLDMDVPLTGSLAGYCLQSGNVVWVDDLPNLSVSDPLKTLYRGFQYVGVSAPNMPKSEYVFPIGIITGFSNSLIGVLNCEWYGSKSQSSVSPFRDLHRNVVNDLILALLHEHAVFLALGMNSDASHVPNWGGILDFHKSTLTRCLSRLREGAESGLEQ